MIDLKKDFNNRLNEVFKNPLFSSFSGDGYSSKEIQFYFFFICREIPQSVENVILICNPSIESHILSTFFILSRFNIVLLNNSSYKNLNAIENPVIIVLDRLIYEKIHTNKNNNKLLLAPKISDFIKWCHPSFDYESLAENFSENTKIGKSIFLSSGSTGKPKIIPLDYFQINECYKNGHRIIIYTARGMTSFKGNVNDIYSNLYELTKLQLDNWGINYHQLIMGKVHFDLFIDDKAINSSTLNSYKDIESFF